MTADTEQEILDKIDCAESSANFYKMHADTRARLAREADIRKDIILYESYKSGSEDMMEISGDFLEKVKSLRRQLKKK